MDAVPLVRSSQHRQPEIEQILDDFSPADARVGLQKVGPTAALEAQSTAPGRLAVELAAKGKHLVEAGGLPERPAQLVAQVQCRALRGWPVPPAVVRVDPSLDDIGGPGWHPVQRGIAAVGAPVA